MTDENETMNSGEVFAFPAEMVAEMENEARTDELEGVAPTESLLTLEDFQSAFVGLFGVAATVTNVHALAVSDAERAGADKTAEKVYRLFEQSPTLRRWFLANGGAFVGDWVLIMSFIGKKSLDVVAEVRGCERKDVLTAAGEKIGRGVLSGLLGKLKFWGK